MAVCITSPLVGEVGPKARVRGGQRLLAKRILALSFAASRQARLRLAPLIQLRLSDFVARLRILLPQGEKE